MAIDEAWDMLKNGNMPPPSPPYDPDGPDSPQNDDTTMDNSRNYRQDASRCPACEQPTTANHSTCQTLGCSLSPNRQLSPEMEGVLRRKPVMSGRRDLLPPENKPATAGPDFDNLADRREEYREHMRDRYRRN
jgi:hypothetical protein